MRTLRTEATRLPASKVDTAAVTTHRSLLDLGDSDVCALTALVATVVAGATAGIVVATDTSGVDSGAESGTAVVTGT